MTSSARRLYVDAGNMALSEINCAETYFRGLARTLQTLAHDGIDEVARALLRAYQDRSSVFVFGNGGSAALASHLACDLGKGTAIDGCERFRVLSLTDNVPLMTAWANDARYEDIFAEQLRNFIRPGDVAFGISGSGNSPNVLNGLRAAREAGGFNIGLAGYQGGRMKALCDLCVIVPSENMQVIEDLHLSISHCVFSLVHNEIAELAAAVIHSPRS
jgi:D-sedoheptulose 7-phosphate isomerase